MTVANDTCSVFQFIKLARKNTLEPWEMEIVSVVQLSIRVQRGGRGYFLATAAFQIADRLRDVNEL